MLARSYVKFRQKSMTRDVKGYYAFFIASLSYKSLKGVPSL